MTIEPEDESPPLGRNAQEVLRILRMFGAGPEVVVRAGMLSSLWARHLPRASSDDLEAGTRELVRAGLLAPGRPDGFALTPKAAGRH